jgi:3-oxoacyl-[acyl-carrier protein] reductase
MSFNLASRVALVTGGNKGLGRVIVEALAEAGATVIINYPPFEQEPVELVQQLQASGVTASTVKADVSVPADVDQMMGQVMARHGRLDVLINNAGIMHEGPFSELTLEIWDRIMAVDLRGVFLCCKAAVPLMLRQEHGRVISIASQLAYKGAIDTADYCAAKAGVVGLTRALAHEYGTSGVTFNCVAPGPLETDLTRPFSTPEWRARRTGAMAMKRMGMPEEVAPAVVFLASDASSYFTGQTLHPNGGGVML